MLICHSLFNQYLIYEHIGCFHFFLKLCTVLHWITLCIGIFRMFFNYHVSSGIIPRSGIAGSNVITDVILLNIAKLSSKRVVHVCFPTRHIWECLFAHWFTDRIFASVRWEMCNFDLHLLRVSLNIFSYLTVIFISFKKVWSYFSLFPIGILVIFALNLKEILGI